MGGMKRGAVSTSDVSAGTGKLGAGKLGWRRYGHTRRFFPQEVTSGMGRDGGDAGGDTYNSRGIESPIRNPAWTRHRIESMHVNTRTRTGSSEGLRAERRGHPTRLNGNGGAL